MVTQHDIRQNESSHALRKALSHTRQKQQNLQQKQTTTFQDSQKTYPDMRSPTWSTAAPADIWLPKLNSKDNNQRILVRKKRHNPQIPTNRNTGRIYKQTNCDTLREITTNQDIHPNESHRSKTSFQQKDSTSLDWTNTNIHPEQDPNNHQLDLR